MHGDRVRHFPANMSADCAAQALVDLCADMTEQITGIRQPDFAYDWGAVAGGA